MVAAESVLPTVLRTSPSYDDLEDEGRLDLLVLVTFLEVGTIKEGGVVFGPKKKGRNRKKNAYTMRPRLILGVRTCTTHQ